VLTQTGIKPNFSGLLQIARNETIKYMSQKQGNPWKKCAVSLLIAIDQFDRSPNGLSY
jgi:hypothetical protein